MQIWNGLVSKMELVPTIHPDITCDGCKICPLKGPRFQGRSHERDLVFFRHKILGLAKVYTESIATLPPFGPIEG
jgi:hypothetical protein